MQEISRVWTFRGSEGESEEERSAIIAEQPKPVIAREQT